MAALDTKKKRDRTENGKDRKYEWDRGIKRGNPGTEIFGWIIWKHARVPEVLYGPKHPANVLYCRLWYVSLNNSSFWFVFKVYIGRSKLKLSEQNLRVFVEL